MVRGGERTKGLSKPFRRSSIQALTQSQRRWQPSQPPTNAFSPDQIQDIGRQIARVVRQGAYLTTACKVAGIHRETYSRWRKVAYGHGTATDKVRPEYRAVGEEVVGEIERALAEMEAEVVADWVAQTKGNWQAARDFLARRFPQRWANSERRALQVTTAGQMELQLRWGDEPEDNPARDGDARDLNLKERD